MFVIWGIGSRRKYTNVFVKDTCDRCGTTENINIIADYKCGTIFFIPVFKFNKKYYEVCPNCGSFKEISKSQFKEIKAANRNGLVYEEKDVIVSAKPVEAIEYTATQEISKSQNSKEEVTKEINEIVKKLKEKEYVLTSDKVDKFKQVLKEQLMKKFKDEQLIDEAIDDYFKILN